MKINKLIVSNGLFDNARFDFSDWTIVFSEKNSSGKTTLIRFILYSLGFKVPSTKGIKINSFTTQIIVTVKNQQYLIERAPHIRGFKVKKVNEILEFSFNSSKELHSFIFGVGRSKLIENILGAFYIDQEHGLLNWNKGTIIGDYTFSIRDFLIGLTDIDLSKEYGILAELRKEREKYTAFSQFRQKTFVSDENEALSRNDREEILHLENKKSFLLYKKGNLTSKLIEYQKMIKDNNEIANFISSMKIMVQKDKNQRPYILTKEDIFKFTENEEWLKANIVDIQDKILVIKEDISTIDFKLAGKQNLFNQFISTTIDEVSKITKSLQITDGQIESIINDLKSKIDDIENYIEDTIKNTSEENLKFITDNVKNYIKLLMPEENFSNDDVEKMIFLKRNDKYSGRILSHLSYAFHLTYIKIIRKHFGVKMPFIIDSPTGKEMTIDNFEKVISIIEDEFGDHNIIIASIYNYSSSKFKTITLEEKLFNKSEYVAEAIQN